MHHRELAARWQLKEYDRQRPLTEAFDDEGWLPASAPGCVHLDLLAAGRIADPFVALNEDLAQWVGNADWLYRCHFDLPPELAGSPALDLCCDGLDTFATVWLNGEQIFASDNMFVPLRADVRTLLRPEGNELRMLFQSALRVGKALESEHGARPLWNGDSSRLQVRKAQYHYGWDWGPCLLSAGPWRPVHLEGFAARIADLRCPVTLSDDLSQATIDVQAAIERAPGAPDTQLALRLALLGPAGAAVTTTDVPVVGNAARHTLSVPSPQLWWPNGYGAQPLYTLAASLVAADDAHASALASQHSALDHKELRLGLRRLRLVQEPVAGEAGTSFAFEVNNTPFFCGGANWIPADSFTPRITPERYRALVELAAAGNMQMLRVWGGGIYEDDAFYELCDELGLLVWQDFMFACGIYPAHDSFQTSVRAEAEAAVARLRHHACLALWCGNNEDYAIAESLGLYNSATSVDDAANTFPARQIYERLLPDVLAQLDPQALYWPGSPYGGASSSDQTVGDRHTWDVWHGAMAPYQDYPKFEGRFVSEFGMASYPALATVEAFAPPDERFPQSRTLEHHNKADGGVERIATYIVRNLRVPGDLEGYIYASQLVQAEAMLAAYGGWRRRWGKAGARAVGGALVWQINDCWPVTSWAIVDSALRPKPAYYVIRRALAPVALGMRCGAGHASIWLVNATGAPVRGSLVVEEWTLDGQRVGGSTMDVELPANEVVEAGAFAYEQHDQRVLAARLVVEERVLARVALWPEPYKYLHLPDPGISVERASDDALRVRCERPAKGVWIEAGDGVAWGDNMLDLVPGDEQVIAVPGLGERAVRVRFLA